ncbi:hypothetical protein PG911_17275 [Tenacibaculum ovolyticum]|uniref:7TM diverse intracellular signaling domain-containing protein n=1 Tax=Tenacibaculum ovolyticum TaxID=104270 RepID=UPI0022F3D29A|nr:7TM diverse intracellular signaling domain-containing protein [Tenacibaculum ovolyticum]WBX76354.1 hypothetical protein PG911_17275 [Tenacibaculum ovolyticum]
MIKFIRFLLLSISLYTLTIFQCNAQSDTTFEIAYFEDTEAKNSLTSIKKQHFLETKKNNINLGITKSALWLKVKLNKKKLTPIAVLIIKTPLKDDINIWYDLKNGETVKKSLGLNYLYSKNKLNHFVPSFEIPVKDLKSNTIFIRVKSRYSMKVPIVIKTKEDFYKERTTEYFFGGIFIGGLLLMGVYNLFLFLSTKDSSYLLYVLALLSAILSQGYLFGILIPFISPESPEFSFRFPIIIMGFTGFFSCWFTIQFLEIKKTNTFFYYALISLMSLLLFNIFIELLGIDYLSRKINILLIITTSTIIFSSALYSLINGNKIAYYFTLAWSFYLFGMTTFALQTLGVIPYNIFTEHIMHLGTFLEVVLLSFALGHKYKLVQAEKNKLENQTRKELEKMVNQQTKKLETSLEDKEVLLKEVHHRVKNNLQIIISLLDLQVASIRDNENKKILAQSKSRVYSMSLIHQKLYQSGNLSHVNIKNYLEELFLSIQNSYYDINKKINYISIIENKELSINQIVPLGLIVNELLTNCFKYGINNKGNNIIKITLAFKKNKLILEIGDSGIGFKEEDQKQDVKKSLGLFLIKSLSKQLKAKIYRYYSNNLFITRITIPV